MDSKERGMDPVAMTSINPWKESAKPGTELAMCGCNSLNLDKSEILSFDIRLMKKSVNLAPMCSVRRFCSLPKGLK